MTNNFATTNPQKVEPTIEQIKNTKSERKQFPLISKVIDGLNKQITWGKQDDVALSENWSF